MKANSYIPAKERRLLLILAFISVILAFLSLAYQIIEHYTKPASIGIYDMKQASLLPWFNFLTLFIFIALLKSKKFIISTLLTLFSFIIFAYEFYSVVRIIILFNPIPELSFVEKLLLIANYFEYINFFLVSILLFWQISILLRMLIKTLQRKTELP